MVLWDLWLSLLVAWMYRPLGLSIIVDCCTCDSSVFGRLLCFFRPHFIATFLTSCPLHYTHVKSWASMSAWYSVQFLLPQLSNIFNLANRVPIVLNRGLTINWKKPICILAILHWLSSPFMYEVTGNFSCCSFLACLWILWPHGWPNPTQLGKKNWRGTRYQQNEGVTFQWRGGAVGHSDWSMSLVWDESNWNQCLTPLRLR